MKVDKLTLNHIFERTERLEAPLFQRPYVWRREKNWQPLWESVYALAEARLDGDRGRPHFLGTIVLDQMKTPTGKIHARQLIDGQQRLTTLQLAIAAARDLAEVTGQDKHRAAFAKLVENDVPLSDDPEDNFKVWPTNADRRDFREVMEARTIQQVRSHPGAESLDDRLIPNAYIYFYGVFSGWLGSPDEDPFVGRLTALYETLRDDLHLVVIDLDDDDDAQEIFETLNALGTPLLPADLVKNFLFHQAEFEGENTERLYHDYWKTFDENGAYWRKEIRQGRLKRPRIDLYLNHYLTLATGREAVAAQLFASFREFVRNNERPASTHMAEFREYADVYRSFDEFPPTSREGIFFYRLNALDTTTVYPLLLEVFRRYGDDAKAAERRQILTDLESFLIRRTICQLTPKGYNRFFVDMTRELASDDDFSANAIRQFLLAETAEISRWPNDQEFSEAWSTLSFYKRLKRARARMVLEAIEARMHTGKTEEIQIEKNLTIEHLMPSAWQTHWPLTWNGESQEEREDVIQARNAAIHRVGNLTLLTKKLNPSISNGPWDRKRSELSKHSILAMNRVLLDVERWDEVAIEERTQALLTIAVDEWPHPGEVRS